MSFNIFCPVFRVFCLCFAIFWVIEWTRREHKKLSDIYLLTVKGRKANQLM